MKDLVGSIVWRHRGNHLSSRTKRGLWQCTLLLASACGLAAGDTPPEDAPGASAANPSAGASSGESALFGDMPVVEAVALHSQTLAEAPASVTIVTASDIHRNGYRTLGDVLSAARGFTFTSDHIYGYSGVRGFAIPGDYNTRFLVMINGHPMTEIVFDSNDYFGQDFGLDLDLVDRIEIIRGPSSALYGSNGILATLNIITKSPVDNPKYSVSTESDSLGLEKMTVVASKNLGKGVNLLVEGAGFLGSGHDLYIPEYAAQDQGIARRLDGQSGYHSFLDLTWGSWNFTAYFNTRLSRAPVLGDSGAFNSAGQFCRDTRDFVGAGYTHDYGTSARLRWQFYYDGYRYSDRYDEPAGNGVIDNRDHDWGDWIGSQVVYSRANTLGELTAGLSAAVEIRNLQENADVSPDQRIVLRVSRPDASLAPFVQQEWAFARNWKAYLGVRLDESRNFGAFLSPRVAVVYQPSAQTSYKVVYGRPFRDPSSFEQYYADGETQVANLQLRPETAHALELTAERRIGKSTDVIVNAYRYWLESVIQAVWLSDAVLQYQNLDSFRSTGIEFELRGHPAPWLQTTASISLQRAADAAQRQTLPDAPARIGKAQAAVPLYRDRIYFSTGLQYLSARLTAARDLMRPVALVDATISTTRLLPSVDFVAGMRNALNWRYDDPVDVIDHMPANGRSVFVKLIWRQRE